MASRAGSDGLLDRMLQKVADRVEASAGTPYGVFMPRAKRTIGTRGWRSGHTRAAR